MMQTLHSNPFEAQEAGDAAAPAISPPVTPTKPKRTAGQVIFDLLVYVGIGWVVNTAISVFAADRFINGAWKETAAKATSYIERQLTSVVKNPERRQAAAKNMFFISTIYTGGTLLVLPMRWLEGHKSSLVRSINNWWHGRDVSHEAEFKTAHREVDNEPKQSMNSLISARLLALPVGLALEPLMGNTHALSTRLLNFDSPQRFPVKNYSSFTRASITLARDITAFFRPALRPLIAEAKQLSPHECLPHEPRAVKIGFLTLYDLMLSAVVATGFYVSSHAFARFFDRRAKHDSAPSTELPGKYLGFIADAAPEKTGDDNHVAASPPRSPGAQVSHVQRQQEQRSAAEEHSVPAVSLR